MAKSDSIPIPYLHECFDYEPESGSLRWRTRPLSHFPDDATRRKWNTRWAGAEAGQTTAAGYRLIQLVVEGERTGIYAHRVAWALMTGEYPLDEIDHDDTNRANNCWGNLKNATHAQNHQNRKALAKGTTFEKRTGRYFARIGVDGQVIHLGTRDTEDEAHQLYLEAKKRYHTYKSIVS
jgi:hypothetical protein